jgi:hypothetical protein
MKTNVFSMILPFRPHHFSAYFSLIFHVLFGTPFGSVFGAQNGDLYSESRFLEPFKISRGLENGPRGDHFEPKGLQRASRFYRGLRPFRDPAFHETTVILVPFGPSVLKNIIFSMMIGYSSVFLASRCAMFYMSFLSHLLKKPQ